MTDNTGCSYACIYSGACYVLLAEESSLKLSWRVWVSPDCHGAVAVLPSVSLFHFFHPLIELQVVYLVHTHTQATYRVITSKLPKSK